MSAMYEEQIIEEISDEIQNQDEGKETEETITQNQGQISHVNELDSTPPQDTLSNKGTNTIILIIIFVIGICIVIFYLKVRKNLFSNSKN